MPEPDLRRAPEGETCGEVGPWGWICTRRPHTDFPHVQHLPGGGADAWMPETSVPPSLRGRGDYEQEDPAA